MQLLMRRFSRSGPTSALLLYVGGNFIVLEIHWTLEEVRDGFVTRYARVCRTPPCRPTNLQPTYAFQCISNITKIPRTLVVGVRV